MPSEEKSSLWGRKKKTEEEKMSKRMKNGGK